MVTLAELKAHLRIESGEEDTLLSCLIQAAKAACEAFCMTTFDDPVPEPTRLAVLLFCGHFYANRESGDKGAYDAMITAFRALLWPYRDPGKLF
jgi:uncharacterized phage protein (predicted DNA packaging)